MNKKLKRLFFKGSNFLGAEFPIMGGAMTWISESNLVSATSNAGGFGVIAAGSMDKDKLEKEIIATKSKTRKPFGVNLILLHPDIEDLIEVCIEKKVDLVVFAGGFPKLRQIQKLKKKKNKNNVFCDYGLNCSKNDQLWR